MENEWRTSGVVKTNKKVVWPEFESGRKGRVGSEHFNIRRRRYATTFEDIDGFIQKGNKNKEVMGFFFCFCFFGSEFTALQLSAKPSGSFFKKQADFSVQCFTPVL